MSIETNKLMNLADGKVLYDDLRERVDAKYAKPVGGIPSTDLASGVQTSLGKADTAYQKPADGIPLSDLADGVVDPTEIASEVTNWLDNNVPTGQTVVVDSSLSISGAAADSKKTGDELNELKSAINDVRSVDTFYPSVQASNNLHSYVFKTGQWYKIINHGDWLYRISIRKNESVVQSCGYLRPNDTIFIHAISDGDEINLYASSPTANATSVSICCGDSIDPQGLNGCKETVHHCAPANDILLYTFVAKSGDGIIAINKGSKNCTITFKYNDVTVERIGALSPGETGSIVLSHDIDQVSCYNAATDNAAWVEIIKGDIASARATAQRIYPVEAVLGEAEFSWLCDGYYVDSTGAFVESNARSIAVVDVHNFTGCRIKGYSRIAGGGSICAYDSNGILISCLYTTTGSSYDVNYDLTVPASAKYILITCGTSYKSSFTFKVEDITKGLSKIFMTRAIEYAPPSFVNGLKGNNADFPVYSTTRLEEMYAWWSVLRKAFSRNMTLVKLGTTTTPAGDYAAIDNNTYDINAYVYQGDDYIAGNDFIVYGGIHGSPMETTISGIQSGEGIQNVVGLAYFVKDFLCNPGKNKTLMYMRKHCRILFVPIVNPWGYKNGTRANARGVDCNRNFDLNFVANQIEYQCSSGTAAFSENESKLLKDYIVENFSNAVFGLDLHTRGANYLPTDTRWLAHSAKSTLTTINDINSYVADYMTSLYEGLKDVDPDTTQAPNAKSYFSWVQDIPTTLIECACAMEANTASLNSQLVQLQYTQYIGTMLQEYVDKLIINPT